VAKTRPVLAVLVMLTPKVKAVWDTATPRQPSAAMGSTSLLPSLLSGSSSRSTRKSSNPPTVNRNATIISWGRCPAAYFVTA
jgi:hypothetical protein